LYWKFLSLLGIIKAVMYMGIICIWILNKERQIGRKPDTKYRFSLSKSKRGFDQILSFNSSFLHKLTPFQAEECVFSRPGHKAPKIRSKIFHSQCGIRPGSEPRHWFVLHHRRGGGMRRSNDSRRHYAYLEDRTSSHILVWFGDILNYNIQCSGSEIKNFGSGSSKWKSGISDPDPDPSVTRDGEKKVDNFGYYKDKNGLKSLTF